MNIKQIYKFSQIQLPWEAHIHRPLTQYSFTMRKIHYTKQTEQDRQTKSKQSERHNRLKKFEMVIENYQRSHFKNLPEDKFSWTGWNSFRRL